MQHTGKVSLGAQNMDSSHPLAGVSSLRSTGAQCPGHPDCGGLPGSEVNHDRRLNMVGTNNDCLLED